MPSRRRERLFRRLATLQQSRPAFLISAILGYSAYYVCRLSLSVVKGPILDSGFLTASQMGVIGSALFYSYGAGKLINGFLADRISIRLMAIIGLAVSASVNLILACELRSNFFLFVAFWFLNGWFQSMGACSFVVGIARRYEPERRGTYYGLWSASHNLGEGLTFVLTTLIVVRMGWRWGFLGSALTGLVMVGILALSFYDVTAGQFTQVIEAKPDHRSAQYSMLRKPAIWLLALASACMYVSRYAISSWGILFLEKAKGYSPESASMVISASSIAGIAGTVLSGWISDRFFDGRRSTAALLMGLANALSLSAFVFLRSRAIVLEVVWMVCFGFSIGGLICFLGGLMAIDIAGKDAAGAALGIIGIASYIGAGTQDVVSGWLIQHFQVGSPVVIYNFRPVGVFWVSAAFVSVAAIAVPGLITRSESLACSLCRKIKAARPQVVCRF